MSVLQAVGTSCSYPQVRHEARSLIKQICPGIRRIVFVPPPQQDSTGNGSSVFRNVVHVGSANLFMCVIKVIDWPGNPWLTLSTAGHEAAHMVIPLLTQKERSQLRAELIDPRANTDFEIGGEPEYFATAIGVWCLFRCKGIQTKTLTPTMERLMEDICDGTLWHDRYSRFSYFGHFVRWTGIGFAAFVLIKTVIHLIGWAL